MAGRPIIAGTDGSEESLRAVDWAAREAVLRGVPLRIVSGAAMPPRMAQQQALPGPDTVSGTLLRERDRALAVAAERAAAAAPGLLIGTDELTGAPARALVEAGAGASMLVVGARGAGAFAALLLGSVSQYVSAQGACPVVVVRGDAAAERRQVVVGVGNPVRSSAALAFAFEEASLRQAGVLAVHAWDWPYGQVGQAAWALATPGRSPLEGQAAQLLDNVLAEWRDKYPSVHVSSEFLQAHPGRALVGLSALADLVVLGRRTTPGHQPGLGRVRHAVITHADGPVVIVPAPLSSVPQR